MRHPPRVSSWLCGRAGTIPPRWSASTWPGPWRVTSSNRMARIEPEVSLPQVIRTLLAALCACAALVPAASHAVYLSPDGLGQALIFPYYTTRAVDGGNAYN